MPALHERWPALVMDAGIASKLVTLVETQYAGELNLIYGHSTNLFMEEVHADNLANVHFNVVILITIAWIVVMGTAKP
jgi:hypothetical protein